MTNEQQQRVLTQKIYDCESAGDLAGSLELAKELLELKFQSGELERRDSPTPMSPWWKYKPRVIYEMAHQRITKKIRTWREKIWK